MSRIVFDDLMKLCLVAIEGGRQGKRGLPSWNTEWHLLYIITDNLDSFLLSLIN